ncbi:hypothetical protein F5Y14DRAFT_20337 [Nemania sp. NC0429]|nr:hypothetical protein F5Y14DRAFT_20337 [Nemania sp. NC0429]
MNLPPTSYLINTLSTYLPMPSSIGRADAPLARDLDFEMVVMRSRRAHYLGRMEPDDIKNLSASMANYALQQSQQPQQHQQPQQLQQSRSFPQFIQQHQHQHQHQQNQHHNQQQLQLQHQNQHQHHYQQQHQHQHQLQQQHQLSAAAQQSTPPPRQYTTVGSVYNPQSQPLQPPVRRGRTVKSLFPYKSESPAGQPQPQYTPLQQNSDRAVSPVRVDLDSMPSILAAATVQDRQTLRRFDATSSHIHQTPRMATSLRSPTVDNDGAARHINYRQDNGMGAVDDPTIGHNSTMRAHTRADSSLEHDKAEANLFTMGFNSLTNLASYPNPMQRAAQKPRASGSHWRAEVNHAMSIAEAPARMPTAPKAHGAPAPLTAGPPGTRQRRPLILERDTLQRARDFDDENPMMNPYHARPPSGRQIGHPSFEDDNMPTALTLENTEADDAANNKSKRKVLVVDTISLVKAHNYYPRGLPPNFHTLRHDVSPQWDLERLAKLESLSDPYLAQTPEFWAERAREIDKHFYTGANMFNKTVHMALSEHKRRSIAHLVGFPYDEQPTNQGKVINRELRVCDASIMPTSEHTAPLLFMALRTIINHPTFWRHSKLPGFGQSLYPPYLKR